MKFFIILLIGFMATWAHSTAHTTLDKAAYKTSLKELYQSVTPSEEAECQALIDSAESAFFKDGQSKKEMVIAAEKERVVTSLLDAAKIAWFVASCEQRFYAKKTVRTFITRVVNALEAPTKEALIEAVFGSLKQDETSSLTKKSLLQQLKDRLFNGCIRHYGIETDTLFLSQDDLFAVEVFVSYKQIVEAVKKYSASLILNAISFIEKSLRSRLESCKKDSETELKEVDYLLSGIEKIVQTECTNKPFIQKAAHRIKEKLAAEKIALQEKYMLNLYAKNKPALIDLIRRHYNCLNLAAESCSHGDFDRLLDAYKDIVSAYIDKPEVDVVVLVNEIEKLKNKFPYYLMQTAAQKAMLAILSEIEHSSKNELSTKTSIISAFIKLASDGVMLGITKMLATKEGFYKLLEVFTENPQGTLSSLIHKGIQAALSVAIPTLETSTNSTPQTHQA